MRCCRFLALAFLLVLPAPLLAEEAEPLWEIGLGGGAGWLPDYPAAGQNHVRGLALPYAIYRGKTFQAGEGSVARGLFVNTDRFEFDVSFAGSLPVDSDDNDARDGLDDLDYLGEVGPSLTYYLRRDGNGNNLHLDLALRAVLSTDFSDFDYVGLILQPKIAQDFADVGGIEGLETNWTFSLRLADEGVMDLFYEVPADGANADRQAFDAKAGYLGASLTGSVSYPVLPRLTLALAAGVASYAGATNRDSDLFIDQTNVAVGLGFFWTFWESDARAE